MQLWNTGDVYSYSIKKDPLNRWTDQNYLHEKGKTIIAKCNETILVNTQHVNFIEIDSGINSK